VWRVEVVHRRVSYLDAVSLQRSAAVMVSRTVGRNHPGRDEHGSC
jgi:hypothetical protein